MSERAAVFIIDKHVAGLSLSMSGGLFVRRMNEGDVLPELVRLALDDPDARIRWYDPGYMMRYITGGILEDGEEYTLSTQQPEVDGPFVVVDLPNNLVAFTDAPYERDVWQHVTPFEEFCDQIQAVYP